MTQTRGVRHGTHPIGRSSRSFVGEDASRVMLREDASFGGGPVQARILERRVVGAVPDPAVHKFLHRGREWCTSSDRPHAHGWRMMWAKLHVVRGTSECFMLSPPNRKDHVPFCQEGGLQHQGQTARRFAKWSTRIHGRNTRQCVRSVAFLRQFVTGGR